MASPGDRIGVLSDGAGYARPPDTAWQLLAGDGTAPPGDPSHHRYVTLAGNRGDHVDGLANEIPVEVPPGRT